MKFLVIFFVAALSGVFSLPLTQDDHRFTVFKDDFGRMHLLDLNPMEAEVEPAFVPEADIVFLLFTRANPTVGQRITWTPESIANSNFRNGGQTRFVVHGWTGSASSPENIFTTRDFLTLGDYNVIVVDWGVGASANYVTSRNRVGPVGEVIARLIDFFVQQGLTSLSHVNIVGHSLGSHVAGHTGKSVQSGRVNAIFGTDPAGPLFSINTPGGRLDVEDAVYTEAIHTNAGGLGFDQPITHAAFYPNWGSTQPGCGTDTGCAHARATLFYSESINSNIGFVSRQCASYAQITSRNCPGTGVFGIMGGDNAKSIRGVFFLETNSAAPFAQG